MSNSRPAHGSPHPRLFASVALLSLAGLADSIYLTVTHLTGENAACFASSGCSEVLSSVYASVGKIPLAAFGAWGYFAAFSCAILAAFGYPRVRTFLTVIVAGMVVTTLWLLYVQAFVLHAFCDFCLISAALSLSLSALVATSYFIKRRHRPAAERAVLLES
ncbi:MAG TPA: vitamin K epoxide reductase family protein [Chthoniobacterales bacterium]|nr:vitamin K epoxide reductase family protein [Chthoniobacterales bacterium]